MAAGLGHPIFRETWRCCGPRIMSSPTIGPDVKALVSQRWGEGKHKSGIFGFNILLEFYLQN